MLIFTTTTTLKNIKSKQLFDFFINCTDDEYKKWWPNVHFKFHTIKRFNDNIGNLVYFDEYIGKYRLKSYGIITELVLNSKIVYQLKKVIKLPVWVTLVFEEKGNDVILTHTILMGYKGIGKLLDFLLRLYFTKEYSLQLDEHVKKEFSTLVKIINKNI